MNRTFASVILSLITAISLLASPCNAFVLPQELTEIAPPPKPDDTPATGSETSGVTKQPTTPSTPQPPNPAAMQKTETNAKPAVAAAKSGQPSTKEAAPTKPEPADALPTNIADDAPKSVARGRVYVDLDADGKFSDSDAPFAGIRVSNGEDIVVTDEYGKYSLPIGKQGSIFVIKPSEFRTRLNKNNLPQYYYLHKPEGSPKLRYPGSQPTGPLPQNIDFPLYQQSEPEDFKILLFGDPQPRNNKEVDYIAQDVIKDLVGKTDNAFGVTLGDIAFDKLETFDTLNQSIALIGIPWYNVIGNHDLNFDGKNRDQSNETFEATYGPTYYSFDYGQVHFVVMDNIDWVEPNDRVNRMHYEARFGERQLKWLEKDLSMIPESQMVVLMMHIPIISASDKAEVFRMIEQRPYCVSISGHTHDHRHLFLGTEEGFNGEKPHHHIINVTVSGAWWSGAKNENGIPHTTMKDGAPNGYSIMSFDQTGYRLDFRAAGQPATDQLRIEMPTKIDTNKTSSADVWVNVFNGSEKSTVRMSVDNKTDWVKLKKTIDLDPYYVQLHKRDANEDQPLAAPKPCYHLWRGKLPSLKPGVHLVVVKTTDRHGRTYSAHRTIRVTGEPIPLPGESSNEGTPAK
ncbi:MAG: calcineurin-like phosphoesterase family protein [Planctomycetota bacterium]